ncbi:MAG TPA: hypothetical protein EYM84_01935 [Flavobacteriales bacterium]|nr:hypothetical protein [Flavobacteriales bacterium]
MKLKLAIGKYLMHQEMNRNPRKVNVVNLAQAKTIGMTYNATNRQDYELVKKFTKYLKEKGKSVISLGYIDSKDPGLLRNTQLDYRFFTKKDLNWYFKPNCLEVNNFLERRFDILLDLGIEYCFPLKYICGLSKAGFKVGPSDNNAKEFYDMMIDVGKNKTLENFLKNVDVYINMVNKKKQNTTDIDA